MFIVQKINNHFGHILFIFCSFRALYMLNISFYVHQFVRIVKAKCVFCFIKIQYYLSFVINSCFDQFRLSHFAPGS